MASQAPRGLPVLLDLRGLLVQPVRSVQPVLLVQSVPLDLRDLLEVTTCCGGRYRHGTATTTGTR